MRRLVLLANAACLSSTSIPKARICPVASLLPTIPTRGSVRVRFLAGYGPDWSDLPADLAQAVMMLGAHYYEYRHETGLSGRCMPFGVTSLLERYRTVRVFAGRAS